MVKNHQITRQASVIGITDRIDGPARLQQLNIALRVADAQNTPIDPDLQAIIKRWPELPDAVKAGILAMVHTSGDVK